MSTITPYKGLEPYDAEDRHLFFGREDDRKILIAKIFSARVTLFFGVTGAGKSSLLRAGVIPELTNPEGYGLDVISHFKWNPREDPRLSLKASIKEALFVSGIIDSKDPPGWQEATLKDFLERYDVFASDPLVIIIDQFEEVFLYHAFSPFFNDFIQELSDAINNRDLSLAFVVSMREDFLAELDVFWNKMPSLTDNRYRLEKLTIDRAREAIVKPLKVVDFKYEPQLIDQLLTDLSGREHPASSPQHPGSAVLRGGANIQVAPSYVAGPASSVEAPYLQIVCRELWEDARHNYQDTLSLGRYEDLGRTKNIVRGHVERMMEARSLRDQALAFQMFQYLVTGRGTKMVYREEDLADTLGVPLEQIRPILEHLEKARILRRDNRPDGLWYELYHDVFAEIIKQWTEQFQQDEDRHIYSRIVTATREWNQKGQDEETLLKGGLLAQAEEWAKSHSNILPSEEQRFLDMSLKKYYHGVWIRRGIVAVIMLFAIIAAVGGFYANKERKEAVEAQKQADKALKKAEQAEKDAKYQLTQNHFVNGSNARDWRNAPLKASHYFMKAAELSTSVDSSKNAQLAGDMLVRSIHLNAILKHKRPVNGAVFSQDASRVLTWSADGTARVWDSASGQALTPPLEHTDSVNGAVFSQDASRVLTWSADGTARVWDSASGQALTPPLEHKERVYGAVFSQDAARVLTWSADGTARVWDSVRGQALTPPLEHKSSVNGAVFSQDESRVLTWSADGTARMWDSASGQALTPPLEHTKSVNGAVFSQDEARVLTWSADGTARVWDSASGQALTPPLEHKSSVNGAVFSQDESRVLTWSADGTARMWDSASGQALTPPLEHTESVNGAVFSQDESRVLTWSGDNTARVWDSTSGQALTPPLEHKVVVRGAVFSQDESRVLTWSSDGTPRVWDSTSGQALTSPRKLKSDVRGVVFSQDAARVLTWSGDNTARVWDSTSGQVLTPSLEHKSWVEGAVFSQDASRVLTWSGDGTARVWDSARGQALTPPLEHTDSVNGAVFSQDASRVLTWSADGTARVWDSTSGQALTPPLEHTGSVNGAMFSQDTARVLTWSADGTARVWDSTSGQALTPPLKHTGSVNGAMFSQDTARVLTWSADGTARVWDSTSGQALTPPLKHTESVNGAVFSQDASRVLTWSKDGTARLWDSARGQALTPPLEHTDSVNGAVFSQNESQVLTWSGNGTVRVWDSARGQALALPTELQSYVRDAVFSQDASRVLTWDWTDNTARVWDSVRGQALTPPLKHKSWVEGAVFSQDASRVLTWSLDNTARVWDSASGKALTPPLEHTDSVRGAVFSQDEARVLTWSGDKFGRGDGTVWVWDSASGQALTPPLEHTSYVRGAVFSQDASRVLTWGDGTVRVWDLQADYDFPRKHLVLQLEVQTGTQLTDVGDLEALSFKAWQEKKRRYEEIAQEHLREGDYPRANLLLTSLMNRPDSCERPGDWLREVNPEVISQAASKYASICLNRGDVYLQRKDNEQATRVFETALQLRTEYLPHDARQLAEAYERLARALIESAQDLEKGMEYAQKSLELNPYQPPDFALKTLALGYRQQEQNLEAAEAYLTLGRAFTRWKDYVSALEAYQQVVELHPELEENIRSEYAEAHYGLARNTLKEKKYEEAVQEIQQARQYGLEAAKVAEFHSEFHYELANAYLKQEKYEEAVQEYEHAVQYGLETAKAAEFHVTLAHAYLKQEKYEEAVREYEQAIQYGFGNAKTHGEWFHSLAEKLIDIDIDKGIEYAQKSLEFDPDQSPHLAMNTLVWGYIKQGRHAEAIEVLEQALEKATDDDVREILQNSLQKAKEGLKNNGVME